MKIKEEEISVNNIRYNIIQDTIYIYQKTKILSDFNQVNKINLTKEVIKKIIDLKLNVIVEKTLYQDEFKKKDFYNFSNKEFLNLKQQRGKTLNTLRIVLDNNYDFNTLKNLKNNNNNISNIQIIEDVLIDVINKEKSNNIEKLFLSNKKTEGNGELFVFNSLKTSGKFKKVTLLGGSRNNFDGEIEFFNDNIVKYEVKSCKKSKDCYYKDFQISQKIKKNNLYLILKEKTFEIFNKYKNDEKYIEIKNKKKKFDLPGTTFFNYLKEFYLKEWNELNKIFKELIIQYLDNNLLITLDYYNYNLVKIYNKENIYDKIEIEKYDDTVGFKPKIKL